MVKFYYRLLAFIFFFFFTSTSLSPEINGVSAYIYALIPFFDFKFIKIIFMEKKYKNSDLYIFIILVLILFISKNFFAGIKLIVMGYIVLYLEYLYFEKKFYLNKFMLLNIIIAIIQYISLILNKIILIDQRKIAKYLYGDMVIRTGNIWDFENPLMLVRVSGLSKEPGFFSAILIFSFLVNEKYMKNKTMRIFYIIGILISFSKITTAFFVVYLSTIFFYKYITKINKVLVLIITVITLYSSINYLYIIKSSSELGTSIVNRTISYIFVNEMTLKEFCIGIKKEKIIDDNRSIVKLAVESAPKPEESFSGGGVVTIFIEYGLCIIILFMLFILNLKIDSYYFLLYLAGTSNVNPLTMSSFAILGIFLILKLKIDDKKHRYKRNIN